MADENPFHLKVPKCPLCSGDMERSWVYKFGRLTRFLAWFFALPAFAILIGCVVLIFMFLFSPAGMALQDQVEEALKIRESMLAGALFFTIITICVAYVLLPYLMTYAILSDKRQVWICKLCDHWENRFREK